MKSSSCQRSALGSQPMAEILASVGEKKIQVVMSIFIGLEKIP
jgi:hypothetical protein